MPKFKQPVSLQELTFDTLVLHVGNYCDKLSEKGLLAELIHCVADMKKLIRNHLSGILFAEFCTRFCHTFYYIGENRGEDRPDSHQRAVLEILMDVENVGLTCEGSIVKFLDPGDAHRLQGLKVLDWSELEYSKSVPRGLENYRLQHLTTFISPRICTDHVLEIIGSRCSELKVLKIVGSKDVTDRGLRALNRCSDLRLLNVHYCPVSDNCINELLNVLKKIEQFNVGDFYTIGEESFDVLSRSISLVCPSVKCFALKSDPTTDAHLRSVVALFPNLTDLRFCCPFTGDLCILKDLRSLTKLDFGYSSGGFSIANLKQLLTSVGSQLSHLTLRSPVYVTQNDLNFIFEVCGNIERLRFSYKPCRPMDKLVIPPFRRLKYLECLASVWGNNFRASLEFCEMLELEVLYVQRFDAIFEMTETIMLDNVKFPNLKNVRTFYNTSDVTDRIAQIAENNNLDFSFEFSQ